MNDPKSVAEARERGVELGKDIVKHMRGTMEKFDKYENLRNWKPTDKELTMTYDKLDKALEEPRQVQAKTAMEYDEALNLIERQREALRVAQNALLVSKAYIERRRGGFADTEPEDEALAAIDAVLKEQE